MEQSWGAATNSGRKRKVNEDSYLAAVPIFVVADGMGGHDRGDLASAIAVNEFSKLREFSVVTAELVDEAFSRAAAAIKNVLKDGVGGTTVCGVALSLQDGAPYWLVFNIGDSRAYKYNSIRNTMSQVSVDHSVVQELIEAGVMDRDDAANHRERHVITKALESVTTPDPDYWMIPVEGGDEILLCSDGLCDELTDEQIYKIWSLGMSPQNTAEHLVEAAVAAGGKDNVTVVIVTSKIVGYAANTVQDKTGAIAALVEDGSSIAMNETQTHTIPRHARS